MIAALYIRVSTADQLQGYSLDAQEHLLRDYADRNGIAIYGLYADQGKSANKALHKRTELLRMVKDAEAGLFQVILFKDITRWSRNSAQYYAIQERLDKAGVSWIAVEQPYLETRTPTGRFQVSVMLGTAQLESENTSQRVRFVQDRLVATGGVLSGKAPIGYRIAEQNGMKRLVIDEAQKPMVSDLFQHYLRYHNQSETRLFIYDKYGVRIWASRLSSMLRSPIYMGEYRDNPDYCEPYISKADWYRIQNLAQLRQPNKHNQDYLFRSLLVCPECGHIMVGNYKHGTIYYRCGYSNIERTCNYRRMHRQDRIESEMIDAISLAMDSTEIYEVPQTEPEQDSSAQIERLNRKLNNLKELFIDGDIDKASYNSRRDALKAEISRLQAAQDKSTVSALNLLETPWRALYCSKNNADRAEWWRLVLERIDIVGDGYIPTYRQYGY